MFKTEHINCLECGWEGQIEECGREKQWSEWAGGTYVAVPLCPKCESEHLADYDSQEAKDARGLPDKRRSNRKSQRRDS